MPTVALCIPAYNAAVYLTRLLHSANNQHIPFDEILVYDDCSTDDTPAVATQLGAKVISGTINYGCSFGKNRLAEATSCDWIHFHDADDDLLPEFTEKVHQWIDNTGGNYDVLLLNFRYIDAASGIMLGTADHDVAALHHDALKYAIEHKIVNFGLYRRTSFLETGGFDLDERVLYNEDNAFHQRLAKSGLRFDYMPEITCVNYRYSVSMSASNRQKCARATFHVFRNIASSHSETYPAEIGYQLWTCSKMLSAEQDWSYVEKALSICKQLGYGPSSDDPALFRFLARINPFMAFWMREKLIRLFKPALRRYA